MPRDVALFSQKFFFSNDNDYFSGNFSLLFCLISTNMYAEENRNDDIFQINVLGTNLGSGFSAGIFLNENILLSG